MNRKKNNDFLKRFMYFTWTVRVTEAEKQRDLPSASSCFKWLQQSELRQSEAKSQRVLPGLSCGSRGSRTSAMLHCFPRYFRKELGERWSSWMGSSAHTGCLHHRQRISLPCLHTHPCNRIVLDLCSSLII